MGKGNGMSNTKGEGKHTVSARQPSRDGRVGERQIPR